MTTLPSRGFAFLLSSLLLGSSTVALAQSYEGPRLLGFAEARRALEMGNDAIYVNPAGLAFAAVYRAELAYLNNLQGSGHRLNSSIIDGQAGPVSGGLAYTYTRRRPDDVQSGDLRFQGHRFDLALAAQPIESVAFGLTARYLTFRQRGGDSGLEDSGFDLFTVDVGFQWRMFQGLSVGLVGYNLTHSDRPEVPISWGAGLGYRLQAFSVESDIRYNAQKGKPRFSGSAGYVVAEVLALRLGLSYERSTQALSGSAGIGVALDQLSLDVGYRQTVSGDRDEGDDPERMFGVALAIEFV